MALLVYAMTLEDELRKEETLDQFKANTFVTNPTMYDTLFADTKEKIEHELEWVHPDQDELDEMIANMQNQKP